MNTMRINFVLALTAALLVPSSLLAQPQGVFLRKELPTIAVGSGLTIHFLSPEPIQYVDISSQRLVGDLPVENLLRIRIKEDSLPGDKLLNEDLGLLTIVGESFMAQFNLYYRSRDDKRYFPAHIAIRPEHTRPLAFPDIGLTKRQMKLHALSMLSARNRRPVRKSKAYGIEMRLNGIYTVGDYLFLDISLYNRTNLSYSVDELRFSIDDRKIARATNVQSIEINPIWQLYPLTGFKKRHRNIFVLKKLTFPENKLLTIRLAETQLSGRTIELTIKYKDLLQADSF